MLLIVYYLNMQLIDATERYISFHIDFNYFNVSYLVILLNSFHCHNNNKSYLVILLNSFHCHNNNN